MSIFKQVTLGAGLLAVLVCLGGCSPSFDIDVALDPSLSERGTMPSVEVHLVGVSQAEYKGWESMSMSDYWKNPLIREGTYVIKLGQGIIPVAPKKNDPIWKRWGKAKPPAKYLFVLSSYPPSEDKYGEEDPRRCILPLESNRWPEYHWGRRDLPIRIKPVPSGVCCLREFEREQ